ncbi:hypothetical protein GFS60_04645 [Rhodococcus sp. WAY2]|nr:hypothetical protein GFS60_04645 [Rhodococcus sp. WAY2]
MCSDLLLVAEATINRHTDNTATCGSPWAASLEILMRFYGPEKAFIDKTWQLPDIELTEQ